jgi:chaperonin GroEL
VTVSKSINLKIPIQRMGAELIREAAQRTNEVAGDGTTTATVLTKEMIVEGLKFVAAGYNTTELIRGIEWTVSAVIGKLNAIAKQIESFDEIVQIGTISANGDSDIGTLIADAMKKVGRDGIITVEDAKGMATTMDVVEGMQFERGYLSPYFVTNNEKMQAAYADACVLVTDKKISTLASIVPLLEDVKKNNKSLLIVADEIEGEALTTFVLNKLRGTFNVLGIKAPGFGDRRKAMLEDIAVLTGGKVISEEVGLKLENTEITDLGQARKVTATSIFYRCIV